MILHVGEKVGYVSRLGDNEFQHVGRIHTVLPDGIPSCKEPMVMIEGKAGVVLASHCIYIPKEAA